MTASKMPPRATQRPSSAPKSRTSEKPSPSKRREVQDDDAPQPKRSSAPDNMGALDYLIEYKELALALVVGLIGYGTYCYFQPYFAAQEAAKLRPVVNSAVTNSAAAPSGGMRESTTQTQTVSTSTAPVTVAPLSSAGKSSQVTSTSPKIVASLSETPSTGVVGNPKQTPSTGNPPTQQATTPVQPTGAGASGGRPTIGGRMPENLQQPSSKQGGSTRVRPGF